MSRENAVRFEEMLREDEALRARLDEAAAAFEGDKADHRAAFEGVVAPLAAELGIPFSYEDASEAAADGREVSDEELEAVAGGGFCFIIGGNKGPEINCHIAMGYACAYVGVTAR